MDWISVWDHFYEAPPIDGSHPHFEAIACMAALATETERVRIGCLVFCVPYRNPALLAKALTTLDHLSHGRIEAGLGAGWHSLEFEAYGYPFERIGTRMDMLEEGVAIVRGLLTQERTTFQGRHYRVENAACQPPPVQPRLPIWIGGLGEQRTLPLAARHADGWNAAYPPQRPPHRPLPRRRPRPARRPALGQPRVQPGQHARPRRRRGGAIRRPVGRRSGAHPWRIAVRHPGRRRGAHRRLRRSRGAGHQRRPTRALGRGGAARLH